MWNELPSTQHRRTHHDDGERARLDRLAREAEVRDGTVRAPGEPPAQQDVDRFRALFAGRGNNAPRAATPKEQAPRERETVQNAQISNAAPEETPIAQPRPDMPQVRAKPEETGREAATHDETASHETPARPTTNTEPVEHRDARAAYEDAATERATTPSPKSDAAARDDKTRMPGSGDKAAHANGNNAKVSEQHALHGDAELTAALSGSAADKKASSDAADDSEPSASPNAAPPAQISAEAASFVQAHRFTMDAPQQAPMVAATAAPALAELIEKHVKQMLVSDTRTSRLRSREILLQMHGDVLPGTDLWLTRTTGGWKLRADVRSRDAYDALIAGSDELIQRFADGALGELTIEPVFHGSASASSVPLPKAAG